MLRVLVVDDSPDVTASLSALLSLWGHNVRAANGGLVAVAIAELFRPDVVLLDLAMPGVDGAEVASRLRAWPGGGDLLLVAMTGLQEDVFRRLGLGPLFHLYLAKPVCPDQLEQVLDGRAALGPGLE